MNFSRNTLTSQQVLHKMGFGCILCNKDSLQLQPPRCGEILCNNRTMPQRSSKPKRTSDRGDQLKCLSLNSSSYVRARHKSSVSNCAAMASQPFQIHQGLSDQSAYRFCTV